MYIGGLTCGPSGGWTWDGTKLTHPLGIHLTLTPEARARVAAAVAAYQEPRQLTGAQIQQLPEDDRDGWVFSHVADEVHGVYSKGDLVPGVCEFSVAEVVSFGRPA